MERADYSVQLARTYILKYVSVCHLTEEWWHFLKLKLKPYKKKSKIRLSGHRTFDLFFYVIETILKDFLPTWKILASTWKSTYSVRNFFQVKDRIFGTLNPYISASTMYSFMYGKVVRYLNTCKIKFLNVRVIVQSYHDMITTMRIY